MALESPLPADFEAASDWIINTPLLEVHNFWSSHLVSLRSLALNPHCSSDHWYNLRPDFFRLAPSSLNIALVAQLSEFCGLGGSRWLSNYIRGFLIAGTICQSGVSPLTLKPDNHNPLNQSSLLEDSAGRFKTRANRRPPHSQILRTDALARTSAGWLDRPRLLGKSGRFADSPSLPIANAFRFAVAQGEKARAFDDLKASIANRPCKAITPISPPSWGHIAQSCLLISDSRYDWSLGKGDESGACKKQPLRPSDALLAVTTLMRPDDKWYGFVSRSQISRSTASVVHYNALSRLLATLICRLIGLPCIGYFDDYAFLVPRPIQVISLITFREFISIIGTLLNDKKCSIGPPNTFLGIRGTMPRKASGVKLSISLDREKSERRVGLISQVIKDQSVDHGLLDKLIGELSFAQTTVFGEFARTLAQPLYDMMNAHPYREALSGEIITNLKCGNVLFLTSKLG